MQTVFNSYINQPHYHHTPLLLKDLYLKICHDITEDIDLKNNFERVINRINYDKQLNCCDIEQLQSSWKNQFKKNNSLITHYSLLITHYSLLLFFTPTHFFVHPLVIVLNKIGFLKFL